MDGPKRCSGYPNEAISDQHCETIYWIPFLKGTRYLVSKIFLIYILNPAEGCQMVTRFYSFTETILIKSRYIHFGLSFTHEHSHLCLYGRIEERSFLISIDSIQLSRD